MASTRRQTARYRYDALGRRIQRSVTSSPQSTKFIYDGQDVLVDDNSGTLTKYLNGGGIEVKKALLFGIFVVEFVHYLQNALVK